MMDPNQQGADEPGQISAGAVGTSDFTDFPNQFLLFALAVFLLVFSLFPLQEADAFEGLASGLEIVRHGITEGGADWFHDLILALVFRGNGASGVVILRAIGILMFSIHGFGFLLGRGLPPATASLCLALAVFCMFPVFSASPILSGIVFAGGLFFMLVRGPGRGIQWTLPLLFLIWANTAGSTILPALAATAIYSIGLFLESFFPGKASPPDERKQRTRLAIGVLISAGIILLQPDTTAIYRLGEFSPPMFDGFWLALRFVPLLVLVVAAFVPEAPRRLPHLFTAILLAMGALLFGGAWIGIGCAAFPFLLAPMLAPMADRFPRSSFSAITASGILLLAAAGISLLPGRLPVLGMDESGYPAATVGKWLSHRSPSPVYCKAQWRGYVAFRLAGRSGTVTDQIEEGQSWITETATLPSTGWRTDQETEDGQILVRKE